MIEGNLEVQLPTTWTDVATVGRAVREEKGREKIRDEKGRSKKIKVREKVKCFIGKKNPQCSTYVLII